ncbi:MAG: hypothetical protein EPN91_12115 [Salinibacterium sp.]|nr:MAG: hypothetical protein EPN91_12115 [Salinibacterium sp.]
MHQAPDESGSVRGTPRHQRSSNASRPVRGRESLLRLKYLTAHAEAVALRDEALETVRHLLPPAKRLHYTASYHGLHQAEGDAASIIGRLESLARRHEKKAA